MHITYHTVDDLERILTVHKGDRTDCGEFLFRFVIDVTTQSYRKGRSCSGFSTMENKVEFASECCSIIGAVGGGFVATSYLRYANASSESINFHPDEITGYLGAKSLLALIDAVAAHKGVIRPCGTKATIHHAYEVLTPQLMSRRLSVHRYDISAAIGCMFVGHNSGRYLPFGTELLRELMSIPAFNALLPVIECKETEAVMNEFCKTVVNQMVADGTLSYDSDKDRYTLTSSSKLVQNYPG